MYVCMYTRMNGCLHEVQTPTRKSYARVGADGDLDIGLHGIGSGHSSVGRVAKHRNKGKTLYAWEMNTYTIKNYAYTVRIFHAGATF